MPDEFEPKLLVRRTPRSSPSSWSGLVLLLAPGLGEVRHLLAEARPEWPALAVAFEALSCVSYVLMFRPIFCRNMPWRTSREIGLSELGAGSIVPASGAGGLALGAWILREGGMPAERIAACCVLHHQELRQLRRGGGARHDHGRGPAWPDLSPWLTAVPAAGALRDCRGSIGAAAGVGAPPTVDVGRTRKRCACAQGARGRHGRGVQIVRSRELFVIAGSVGYCCGTTPFSGRRSTRSATRRTSP